MLLNYGEESTFPVLPPTSDKWHADHGFLDASSPKSISETDLLLIILRNAHTHESNTQRRTGGAHRARTSSSFFST